MRHETILWLFRIDAVLTRAGSKATWEERFEDLGNVAGDDDLGHQFRCNRCQQQPVPEMSSGEIEAVDFSWAQQR